MRLISRDLSEYEWLKSPFRHYSWRKSPYGVYDITNSIGSHFLVITKDTARNREKLAKEIEIAKYPLDINELLFIMQSLNFNKSVDVELGLYRMQFKQADELFHQAGVYFRLGLLNVPKASRIEILRAYSQIYDFRFILDEWTELDLKEFQRLADTGLSLSEIANEMGKTYNDVFNAHKRYNIILLQDKRNYRYWTEQDIQILKENVGKMTYQAIQERFFPERSLRSVIMTARKHHLSSGKRGRKKAVNNDL